jgi:hypothetical protein
LSTLLFLSACGAPKQSAPRQQAALDLGALSQGEAGAILQALQSDPPRWVERVGPYTAQLSTEISTTTEERGTLWLREDIFAKRTKEAARVTVENSTNNGYDLFVSPRASLLASRFGPFTTTPAAEALRLEAEAFHGVRAALEPCAHGLSFSPQGEAPRAGRTAKIFSVEKAANPRPAPSYAPEQAWRASITLDEATGELAFDAETGILLAADISLRYQATRDGRPVELESRVKATITFGGAVEIEVPERGAEPPRWRPTYEKQQVLGPNAKKAPLPGEGKPSSKPAAQKSAPKASTQPAP